MLSKKTPFILAGIITLAAMCVTATYASNTATTTNGTNMTHVRGMRHGMGSGDFKPFSGDFKNFSGGIMPLHDGIGRGEGFGMMNSGAKAALKANNYTAFVAAIKDTPIAEEITQEKFAEMVAREQKREAMDSALKNNDYAAFVKASTPTEAEFAQMVKNWKERPTPPTQPVNNQ